MALILADRVLETATAPGTGTVTLGGAVSGFQTFSTAIGNSNTTYYVISDITGPNWEVGLGTVGGGGTTLARTTVLSSSNSGSLVNFTVSVNVAATYPAENATLRSTVAGTSFSGTNITGTLDTSGLSLSIAPQTAYVFSNSNNVSFGTSNSTVTASASYPAQTQQPMAYSAANGSATANTLIFANSNGVSFSTGTQGVYATVKTDYQSSGAYLTTAMQSNASTNFAGIGGTFAGTNISGSITMDTAGINLALSVANPGGGAANTISYFEPSVRGTLVSAAVTNGTLYMQPFVLSAPVGMYRMQMLASYTSQSATTVSISASISGGSASSGTGTYALNGTALLFSRLSSGTNANSSQLVTFTSQTYSVGVGMSIAVSWSTNASSATGSWTTTQQVVYPANINSAGAITFGTNSSTGSSTFSSTAGAAQSFSTGITASFGSANMSNIRPFIIPMATTLSAGEYWLGNIQTTSTANTNYTNFSRVMQQQYGMVVFQSQTQQYLEFGNTQTIASSGLMQGWGSYSASSNTTATSGIPYTNITGNSNLQTWFNMMAATK